VQRAARYLLPAEFGIRLPVPGFQLSPKDLINATLVPAKAGAKKKTPCGTGGAARRWVEWEGYWAGACPVKYASA
jgi:hypothetical protein